MSEVSVPGWLTSEGMDARGLTRQEIAKRLSIRLRLVDGVLKKRTNANEKRIA